MSDDLAQDCHESPMWAAAEIERLTNELRGAKAKITILSDLLTDKCDELKELANKQEPDDE